MTPSRSTLNEAQTRQQLIDQQLARAGWGTAERRIVEEYLLSKSVPMRLGHSGGNFCLVLYGDFRDRRGDRWFVVEL